MIVKELDDLKASDKRLKAGHAAEKQIAFYLRRAFAEDPKIQVINGLRLRRQGDVAQIDHLVCHNHGLVVIESKSVTTRVQVNAHGEWSRWSGKQWQGMPSPRLQAQRQADFLRKYLIDLKGIKHLADWQAMPIDILIAISDNGMINRPSNQPLPGVYKAEQITEQIGTIIQQRGKGENLLNWIKVVFDDSKITLKDEAVSRLAQGLVKSHYPKLTASMEASDTSVSDLKVKPKVKPQNVKQKKISVSSPLKTSNVAAKDLSSKETTSTTSTTKPNSDKPSDSIPHSPSIQSGPKLREGINNGINKEETTFNCQHCNSTTLKIVYGKYGYYFKCGACGGNTSIKPSCDACGQRAKLRKQKLNFFVNCEACGVSRLFFQN